MRIGTRSKALWMAALVPLLAASVLPTQIRTLVCRVSGAVMDIEVCCPSEDQGQIRTHAQLIDESCCVVKTVDLQKLVSERRADGAPPRSLLLAAAPVPATSLPAAAPPHIRPVAPPPIGPPLLLLKRSFLI